MIYQRLIIITCLSIICIPILTRKFDYRSFDFGFNNFAEIELDTPCVVEMDKQQTILHQPSTLDKMDR